MKALTQLVVEIMDGSDEELFPFLPYIFQDLWGLGTGPQRVLDLLDEHGVLDADGRFLDLACGKGAVTVEAARRFRCSSLGIDALRDFIAVAREKAEEFDVAELCRFEVGDIRERVRSLDRFDVTLLGSVGPVFGDYERTFAEVSRTVVPGGFVVLDDCYLREDSDICHPVLHKRKSLLSWMDSAGMRLVDEIVISREEIKEEDAFIFRHLRERCLELAEKHPEKKDLFMDYVASQERENHVLENEAVCSTMLLGKPV